MQPRSSQVSPNGHGNGTFPSPPASADLETLVIKAIAEDDKAGLLAVSKKLHASAADRPAVSKLLHLCCAFDAADCAAALLNGDVAGVVPLVNEFDEDARLAPLHAAAHALSARCVEVLLRKHARTELKSKDGRFLIPLELSLASARAGVSWSPEQDGSVEDLVTQLRRKDLRAIKLLSEKTSTLDDVAYAAAIGGRVVDLAALLLVAAEAVTGAVLELHDTESETKEKATLYECVIREALWLGPSSKTAPPPRAAKRNSAPTKGEIEERRKLLLRQIELLQLFGAVSRGGCTDKKVVSPLIRAAQARDEAVTELLLKTSIDINGVDADGNSALHWCLKTAKGSCPHQTKIMCLLLVHGARVCQKNKVGMTAAHFAAANGNLEGLQIVLVHEPDSTNSKTEIKETPLFFAVKNDHKDCAELLLRSGASTEVLNLRRQRPIDFALSQDMRVLLNPTNISLTNLSLPIKKKYIALLQGDEVISETRKDLLCLTDEGDDADRSCSNNETEVCKYFESPTGCVRGSKCFYLHTQERHPKSKQVKEIPYWPALRDSERKVFVGGLPSSVDSDTLHDIFEEHFGSVDNAIVVGLPTGTEIQSRGFGFITFKDKKSVSAAIELHYVTVMGKRVEIKSAVPKWMLQLELQKSLPKHDVEKTEQHLPDEETPGQRTTMMSNWNNLLEKNEKVLLDQSGKEMFCHSPKNEPEAEPRPWIDKLKQGHPEVGSKGSDSECSSGTPPPWLRTFMKWFPHFMQKVYKKGGEYALSSLKADFRNAFGLELDHTSLGFLKLSDFMRSFPELCQIKLVPIDRRKPANHMILVPVRPKIQVPLKDVTAISPSPAVTSISKCSDDTEHLKDLHVSPNGNQDSTGSRPAVSQEISKDGGATSPSLDSRFLQFLRPDPIFCDRTWLHEESYRSGEDGLGERGTKQSQTYRQESHLVLEALARGKSGSFSFFIREFDFYLNYKASLMKGVCFGCDQRPLLCANFPCLHLLWCAECKLQAMQAESSLEHKCVICDKKVEQLVTIPRHRYCQPKVLNNFCRDYQLFDSRCMHNFRRANDLQ